MFAALKRSIREFINDDCPSLAAALSYYTVFSLPPLLLLILLLVGAVADPQDVRGALEGQLQQLMGPAAGAQIRAIIRHGEQPGAGGAIPALIGIGALLFGATGAFVQLQSALNRAWEVTPDPKQGGIKNFLMKRLFSFGMILAIAFLLLVSLVVSAVFSTLGDRLNRFLPEGLSETMLQGINTGVSFVVITALFAAMYRVLPDARIAWRDVWVGAAVTALLFVLGKFLIGLYLGQADPGQAFGAAGSLAILLLWIYYSSLILLFGAEFTQAWTEHRGHRIIPEPGAMRLSERSSS